MHRVGRVLSHPHGAKSGKYVFISAGASVPGVIWNTMRTPSMVTSSPVFVISSRRLDQGSGSGRSGLSEAAINAALSVARQQCAIHVDGAAAHRVTGDHVLADRVLGEMLRRKNLHLAGFNIGLIDDAAHPAIMIDVRMAVDNGQDRKLAEVFETRS